MTFLRQILGADSMINNFLDPWCENSEAEGILSRILLNTQKHVLNIEDIPFRYCIDSIPKNILDGFICIHPGQRANSVREHVI